jgi:hypothetical protein
MNSPQIQQAIGQALSNGTGPYQQATGSPWSGQGQYQNQIGQMSPQAQAQIMSFLQGSSQGQCPPWMPNCGNMGGGGFDGGGGGAAGMYGARAGLTPAPQVAMTSRTPFSPSTTWAGPGPTPPA